jgi:hypothetical protein
VPEGIDGDIHNSFPGKPILEKDSISFADLENFGK